MEKDTKIPFIDCSAVMQKSLEGVVRDILIKVRDGKDENISIPAIMPSIEEISEQREGTSARKSLLSKIWSRDKPSDDNIYIKSPSGATEETDEKKQDRAITIRFRHDHSKVVLCDVLRHIVKEQEGLLIDIRLDKYFWHLSVNENGFSVMLLFGDEKNGLRQAVSVPFSAITHFFYGDHFNIQMIPHDEDANNGMAREEKSTEDKG
mgnify:CR=1 FL=1